MDRAQAVVSVVVAAAGVSFGGGSAFGGLTDWSGVSFGGTNPHAAVHPELGGTRLSYSGSFTDNPVTTGFAMRAMPSLAVRDGGAFAQVVAAWDEPVRSIRVRAYDLDEVSSLELLLGGGVSASVVRAHPNGPASPLSGGLLAGVVPSVSDAGVNNYVELELSSGEPAGFKSFGLRLTRPGGGATSIGVDFGGAELVPAPGAAALLGLGGVVAARRRRG
jgi:hypothetical protein